MPEMPPTWFAVLSTLRTRIGCESHWTGRLQEMTYSESMKSLVAPQSTKAFSNIQAAVSMDCKSNRMCREFQPSIESMTYYW
jgi:hypothetical protein